MAHVTTRPFPAIYQDLASATEKQNRGRPQRVHSDAKSSQVFQRQCCMFIKYSPNENEFRIHVQDGITADYDKQADHLDLGPISDITATDLDERGAASASEKITSMLAEANEEVCSLPKLFFLDRDTDFAWKS